MEQLAIEGGAKLREKPLPSRRDVGAEEMKELVDVIFSGNMYRVGGTKVDEFEREFAKLYGVEHAVASTSGTAAIHVALGAINPDPGSEIVTGPISDIGTIIPILYQNCIPIFADIDPVTYSLDPDSVRRKITDKTVAVIAIHLFGQAANMDELVDVCKEHDLHLIEDASQAHLAEYKGKLAGTIGDLGCFSLQQSKQMTTGDGGVTITNDLDLAERAKLFADKAWPREGSWTQRGYLFLAMNYRMTELQGAVGLAQLRKVRSVVERRRKAGEMLTSMIRDLKGVNPSFIAEGSKHSYWLYPFTIDQYHLKVTPEKFAKALSAEGIPCSHGYIQKPLYLYPVLKEKITYGASHCPFDCPFYGKKLEYREGDCPNAERVLREILTLPINEFYGEPDVSDMARAIRKVATYYASR
jgi:dTDP-4-amino-4,6-dideoxygalactose transaminase